MRGSRGVSPRPFFIATWGDILIEESYSPSEQAHDELKSKFVVGFEFSARSEDNLGAQLNVSGLADCA